MIGISNNIPIMKRLRLYVITRSTLNCSHNFSNISSFFILLNTIILYFDRSIRGNKDPFKGKPA
jgi:hypothetical protein